MRLFFFLLIVLALDTYAFQVLRFFVKGLSANWRWIIFAGYWLMTLVFVLWMIFNDAPVIQNVNKDVKTYLRGFFLMIYAAKMMCIIPLLIDDIRRFITWVISSTSSKEEAFDASRSKFLVGTAAVFGAIPLATLGYGMLRNVYRYKVREQDVAIDNLPTDLDGFRIVQISDIHSGSFAFVSPVSNAVDIINKLQPDIVFFTGDLVNSKADEMEPFIPIFKRIKAKHGVYSIMGNHDYGYYHNWADEDEEKENEKLFLGTHKAMGWNLLRNESAVISVNNARLGILGVENISAKPYFPKHGDLKKTHDACAACDVKILLSHDPSHWVMEVIEEFSDIDLTLSGHTHGFQFGIEIPGVVKWSPSQYMYEQWAGIYKKGMQYLYVNRGLGFLGYPGRVGILPEISLLTLTRKV
jgi:predicted MPP superfamily phosphohydrolase